MTAAASSGYPRLESAIGGAANDDEAFGIDLDFGSVYIVGSTIEPTPPSIAHFYFYLDALDEPGGVPLPGFLITPLGGEPYVPSPIVSLLLNWPRLDSPAGMDAFVLRFDAP